MIGWSEVEVEVMDWLEGEAGPEAEAVTVAGADLIVGAGARPGPGPEVGGWGWLRVGVGVRLGTDLVLGAVPDLVLEADSAFNIVAISLTLDGDELAARSGILIWLSPFKYVSQSALFLNATNPPPLIN